MKKLAPLLFALLLVLQQSFLLPSLASSPFVPSFDKSVDLSSVQITSPARTNPTLNGAYITAIVGNSQGAQLNSLKIDKGNVLLHPNSDVCIGAEEGNIYLKSGAVVFVMASGTELVVYDLYQSNANQVVITTDKDKIALAPGQLLVLTKDNTDDFETLAINCHSIGYRRAQPIKLHSKSIKAFAAEFSILSAMEKVQPLKRLTASTEKTDKAIVDKIFKVAIVLGNLTATTECCLSPNANH